MSKRLIVQRDVETRMRDGVILRADVYRPDATEPLPALLARTPYGKGFANPAFALLAAERGYAVVLQDTRGRWASEGTGYPMLYEREDGYDTVQWVARQAWCNGRVGMYGASYVGYTQWAAAVAQPPALRAIIPAMAVREPYVYGYTGGALLLGLQVSWSLASEAFMAIMRFEGGEEERAWLLDELVEMVDGMAQGTTFNRLPLVDMPLTGRGELAPVLRDILLHSSPRDEYWQRVACAYERVQVPVFHVGGWYDLFIDSTLRDFVGMREGGGTETARRQQKAMVGPWLHGPYDGLVGEVDFGLRASGVLILPEEVQLRWFDHFLKGIENGIMDEPALRIFVMGDNCWRDEHEWPLARTRYIPYYLHSGGAANSLHGDAMLSPLKPSMEAIDSFVYDPRRAVPTRGGGLCCSPAALAAGAFDQRAIEARPDVLVYASEALAEDLEVTGPLRVELWAATTAPDTDWTAKLVDVYPCGYARNVQDGIIRARYRESLERPMPVTPGQVHRYSINLGPTSNVFKAGHRIRVEISSSNFPRFDRNPNTGYPLGQSAELRPALQAVLHDAEHPSHIVLPIIPRGGG